MSLKENAGIKLQASTWNYSWKTEEWCSQHQLFDSSFLTQHLAFWLIINELYLGKNTALNAIQAPSGNNFVQLTASANYQREPVQKSANKEVIENEAVNLSKVIKTE